MREANEQLPTLDDALDGLGLDDRMWKVLHLRVDKEITLEDIGKKSLRVTRERVRQILKKTGQRLGTRFGAISRHLDAIEKCHELGAIRLEYPVSSKRARALVAVAATQAGFPWPSGEALERTVLALRAMVSFGNQEIQARWPRLSFVVCSVTPPIELHRKVRRMIARLEAASRPIKSREVAERVLRNEGKPLHWREIARRGDRWDSRREFNPRSIYHTLLRRRDVFVRVGPGTYGLVEWGLEEAEPYTELIARVLKEAGRPLSYGRIYQGVGQTRSIGKTTLQMLLDMNPRFYKSIGRTYGLRAWLSPRNRQTLRTDREYVESEDSLERINRAIARGYDVEAIVARDYPQA